MATKKNLNGKPIGTTKVNPIQAKLARAVELTEIVKIESDKFYADYDKNLKQFEKSIAPEREELNDLKVQIEAYMSSNEMKVFKCDDGKAELKITNNYSIDVVHKEKLKSLFKDDYSMFVTEKLGLAPTATLRNQLANADWKLANKVRDLVNVSSSTKLNIVPNKK